METADSIHKDCQAPPPPQLLQGLEEFHAGAYYACHETLEDLWVAETGPVRELYQGILQVAVALWHLQGDNYRGAVSLLDKAAGHLRPCVPVCRQVDVALLLRQIATLRQELESLGPHGFRQWNRQHTPHPQLATSKRRPDPEPQH